MSLMLENSLESFDTPILLITYNKVDTTKLVLNQILKQNPKHLIIASDGPKSQKSHDQVYSLRRYFDHNIEIPFTKLYSDTNKGCKEGVEYAITESFKIYDELIILEDDTLPSKKFFKYAENLLKIYKHNKEVGLISGYNYLSKSSIRQPYFFSKYSNIWGWATWKDRWKDRTELNKDNLDKFLAKNESSRRLHEEEEIYYVDNFKEVIAGNLDSWAFGLTFSNFFNKKLSIIPKYNLIKNIGLGHKDATHTNNKISFDIITLNLILSIFQRTKYLYIEPRQNLKEDNKFHNKVVAKKTFYNKFVYKIYKIFKRL